MPLPLIRRLVKGSRLNAVEHDQNLDVIEQAIAEKALAAALSQVAFTGDFNDLNNIPPGLENAQGVQGAQGAAGQVGSQGLQGISGGQGIQGLAGGIGGAGIQGVQGVQGALGIQGSQGFAGLGTQGHQGLQGIQGSPGLGLQGIQGSIGAQGFTGFVGIQGPQGLTGSGTQGIQGIQGPNNSLTTITRTYTTASLAPLSGENFTLTCGSVYQILSITLSHPSWVRFYATTAARDADTRTSPGGTLQQLIDLDTNAPTAEFATNGNSQTISTSSAVPTGQAPGGICQIRLINRDTVPRAIDISVTFLIINP